MSAEISTDTGWRYGLERVCRVLEFPRSTIYAKRPRYRRLASAWIRADTCAHCYGLHTHAVDAWQSMYLWI